MSPENLDNRGESQRFALLQVANVALVIPLRELYALESVLDLDSKEPSGASVGAVRSANVRIAIFSLSDNLEPVATLPGASRICAILSTGDGALGLACESVSSVDGAQLAHHPLPECMRRGRSPIRALALHGERVYCRTSAWDLARHLELTA